VLEDDPMLKIHEYSIPLRIATGKQQRRKQGFAVCLWSNVAGFCIHAGLMSNAQNGGVSKGCAAILLALEYQKKLNNDVRQSVLPTQNTHP